MKDLPDLRELVGEELSPEERARLERVHELLLQAGPPPELPPSLEEPSLERRRDRSVSFLPRRRAGAALALAAAIALVAFLGGYLAGFHHTSTFQAVFTRPMHAAGANRLATAQIRIGRRDRAGNWPLELVAHGLKPLPRGGYYAMYLTRGAQRFTCGTFAAGGGTSTVRLNAPYRFRPGDGWVVTAELPGTGAASGRTVLTT